MSRTKRKGDGPVRGVRTTEKGRVGTTRSSKKKKDKSKGNETEYGVDGGWTYGPP